MGIFPKKITIRQYNLPIMITVTFLIVGKYLDTAWLPNNDEQLIKGCYSVRVVSRIKTTNTSHMGHLLKIQIPGLNRDLLNQNLLGSYQESTCLTIISGDN